MKIQRMLSMMNRHHASNDHERARALLTFMVDEAGGAEVTPEELGTYVFEVHAQALVLSKGEELGVAVALVELGEQGGDGKVHELGDEPEVVLGREAALQFDDEFLSPQHALLSWREGRLFVRDLDSINGSFVRVNEDLELKHEDVFLAGRQVLKFMVEMEPVKKSQGTRLMGSPSPDQPTASVAQIGAQGEIYRQERLGEQGVEIGRKPVPEYEGCVPFMFEGDAYQSERHVRIVRRKSRWVLEDLNSSNGTWIRIDDERELHDGDFLSWVRCSFA